MRTYVKSGRLSATTGLRLATRRGTLPASLLQRSFFEVGWIGPTGFDLLTAHIALIEAAVLGIGVREAIEYLASTFHARILLLAKLSFELFPEFSLQTGEAGIVGKIAQTVGIVGDAV